MQFAYRFILLSLLAGLLGLLGSCFGGALSDGDIPLGGQPGGNTATLTNGQSGSSPGGASFDVPAGTVVTSNSVMNGQVNLGATELASSLTMGFNGEIYGGASYTPADATFSQPVALSIPVSGVIGTAYIYYVDGSSAVSQSGFSVLDDDAEVMNGMVKFSSMKFGSFFIGMPAADHNEGSGGSF